MQKKDILKKKPVYLTHTNILHPFFFFFFLTQYTHSDLKYIIQGEKKAALGVSSWYSYHQLQKKIFFPPGKEVFI